MKRILFLLLFLPLAAIAQRADTSLLKLLKGFEQELADAVALGDTSIWKKYLHESCLITTEDGSVITAQQMISELRPLPKGYVGKIIIIEPKLVRYGNT